MKTLTLFLACSLISLGLLAQQTYVEIGQTTSSFDYEDSEGGQMNNLFSISESSYGLGYRKHLGEADYAQFFYTAGITFNKYGSFGSDPVFDNNFSWEVQYLGAKLGLDFEVKKHKNYTFYARIAAAPEFMVHGTQTINNQVYDLKGVEQFDTPFLNLSGGIGANYCISGQFAFFAQYTLGKGLPLGQGNKDDQETLRINTRTASIGVWISLSQCEYCFKKHFNR